MLNCSKRNCFNLAQNYTEKFAKDYAETQVSATSVITIVIYVLGVVIL